jgi:hypothetical protein
VQPANDTLTTPFAFNFTRVAFPGLAVDSSACWVEAPGGISSAVASYALVTPELTANFSVTWTGDTAGFRLSALLDGVGLANFTNFSVPLADAAFSNRTLVLSVNFPEDASTLTFTLRVRQVNLGLQSIASSDSALASLTTCTSTSGGLALNCSLTTGFAAANITAAAIDATWTVVSINGAVVASVDVSLDAPLTLVTVDARFNAAATGMCPSTFVATPVHSYLIIHKGKSSRPFSSSYTYLFFTPPPRFPSSESVAGVS